MVIQRIQTLYLLLACAMLAMFACLPIAQVNTADASLTLTAIGMKSQGIGGTVSSGEYVMHTWPVFISTVVGAVVALIAIFKYRQMSLQRILCLVVALLTFGSALAAFIISFADAQQVTFSGWCITPFLAFLFAILAYMAIGKDMRLLRSSDTLR